MSAHADCTHEKTKAARAACRAGKNPPAAASATDPSPRARLREKAAGASSKLGEPKGEGGERSPINSKLYISGHCAVGNHERCAGVYAGVNCSCGCDHTR